MTKYIVVYDGSLVSTYDSEEKAQDKVDELFIEDLETAKEDYGYDEDSDALQFQAQYDGGNPYFAKIDIDECDLDAEYETPEGDSFTGGEILMCEEVSNACELLYEEDF